MAEQQDGQYAVMGDYLVLVSGPGDCKGCSGILSPAHEPTCGIEPIMPIADIEKRLKGYQDAVEVLTSGEHKCFWNWSYLNPFVAALDEALGIERPTPPLTHRAIAPEHPAGQARARCGAPWPVQFASDYTCTDC